MSALSPSQQPTVSFSIYQNNTSTIRCLIDGMINPTYYIEDCRIFVRATIIRHLKTRKVSNFPKLSDEFNFTSFSRTQRATNQDKQRLGMKFISNGQNSLFLCKAFIQSYYIEVTQGSVSSRARHN